MNTIKQQSSGGISLGTCLAAIFVTLKLTGVITWSWLWVLSPIWIPFLIVCFLLFLVAVIAAVGEASK